jgi:hypothetical protein
MTIRTLALTAVLVAAAAGSPLAQTPAPAGQPAPPPRARTAAPNPDAPPPPTTAAVAPQPPRREGQPINVKVDVTITDQHGNGATAIKKTVSVVTGDSMSGFIRSNAYYQDLGPVPLNIDTEPQILSDGRIRLRVNLQYDLPTTRAGEPPTPGGGLRKTELRENLALILESGRAVVAAQSADPVGDRQVTVEVKATILR